MNEKVWKCAGEFCYDWLPAEASSGGKKPRCPNCGRPMRLAGMMEPKLIRPKFL